MANGKQMRSTGVYGNPEIGQKKHTLIWLCFGDFNEILHPNEKRGGNDRNLNLINNFIEVLRECNLKDIGYKGYPFT